MKHLIVTVHGIRTYGQWSDRLTSLIKNAEPKAEIVNYAYGYFSFFAFLVPPLRWLATKRFKRALQQELERENWERVDIVAHSFGTHLASYALQSLARSRPIQIHTLILAGSVLRSTFRWDGLIPRSVGRLCNECGVRDYALVASQLFVFLTGMAGRSGFTGALSSRFRNRYFDFGHSGYFEGDDFMRKYWVPLLVNDLDIPPVDQRPPLTAFRGICNVMLNNAQPLKRSGYFGLLFGALFWVVGLLLVSETARDLLGKQIDRANGLLAVSREQLAAALVGAGRSRLTDRPHEAVRYAEAAASLTSDLAPAALLRDAALRYPMYTQLAPANARRSSAQRLTPAPRHTDIFAVDPAFSFVLAVKAIENPAGGSHPTLSTR